MEPSLQELVDSKDMRWIFVGGKGGVGKTTTSCSLAVQLAAKKSKVLIISTDPAHNLSDAFNQRFGKDPVQVQGFDNLFAMEVSPAQVVREKSAEQIGRNQPEIISKALSMLSGNADAIPGIDEIMSFAQLLVAVNRMDYETIVFDTAPTGHTLRLMSFPDAAIKALKLFQSVRSSAGGIIGTVAGVAGVDQDDITSAFEATDKMLEVIQTVQTQFKDPARTSFVCVCIPEFLSLYETERLVQELTKREIDVAHIIVNQLLDANDDSQCENCRARASMQGKYLQQIRDLYEEDFHVVRMPLRTSEVRGIDLLKQFGANLLVPYKFKYLKL
ncbi:Arsenical pump ATPase ArsA/GET3 [Carpediemonas membranifera]|uniref:ATPase ASNA1 homolog n=1 Tax=Carpediemonas membranifera TaxID=201153 RepID=A0A8J6EBH7_9EUKA|nr:Arsenical pump ATPase ArsA/GET3 [Carpediemonas membranifera]|eukprot:KAG9397225.1 Arsenical pump ATPase ArsA/GET3 [Carpediemonas membranifera]